MRFNFSSSYVEFEPSVWGWSPITMMVIKDELDDRFIEDFGIWTPFFIEPKPAWFNGQLVDISSFMLY